MSELDDVAQALREQYLRVADLSKAHTLALETLNAALGEQRRLTAKLFAVAAEGIEATA